MRAWVWALTCAGLLCGCYRKDPRYCDQATPCGPEQVCSLETAACVPASTDGMLPGDGAPAVDLSRRPDLAQGHQLDLAPPPADLAQSCTPISAMADVLACRGSFASVAEAAVLCAAGFELCTAIDANRLATILTTECTAPGGFFAADIPVSVKQGVGPFYCGPPGGVLSGGVLIGCGKGAGTQTVEFCDDLNLALTCDLASGWTCPNSFGLAISHTGDVGGVLCCKG